MASAKQFDAQRSHLQGKMQSVRGELATAALALFTNPDNVNAAAEVQQLESIQAEHHRELDRLDLAEAEAARSNSSAAREQRRQARLATRQRLKDSAQQAVDVGGRLEKAIEALALPLMEWQALKQARMADAFSIAKLAHGRGAGVSDFALLSTGDILTSLSHLVVSCGLGRVGPLLEPFLSITEPSRSSGDLPLADAIAKANTKLLDSIDGALTQIDRAEAGE
jgi:hypothetical protein